MPTCEVRNARTLNGGEAAAYEMPIAEAPKTLEGRGLTLDFVGKDMRPAMQFSPNGELVAEKAVLYVTDSNSVTLKLRIGAEINACFAGVDITRDMKLQICRRKSGVSAAEIDKRCESGHSANGSAHRSGRRWWPLAQHIPI